MTTLSTERFGWPREKETSAKELDDTAWGRANKRKYLRALPSWAAHSLTRPYPGRGVGLPSDLRWKAYPYRTFDEETQMLKLQQ